MPDTSTHTLIISPTLGVTAPAAPFFPLPPDPLPTPLGWLVTVPVPCAPAWFSSAVQLLAGLALCCTLAAPWKLQAVAALFCER